MEINPNLAIGMRAFAPALMSRGRFDEAVNLLKTAEGLDPQFYPARLTLALSEARTGRQREAMADFERRRAQAPAPT